MSRLRSANPEPLTHVSDDQLQERIVSDTPAWASIPPTRSALVATRRGQRWVAGGAVGAAALAAVLVIALSGGAPNVAQAFPILKGSSTITPSELRSSLTSYGVAPNNDGLDIGHGYAMSTRWGTGYVLTNPHATFICVVAPGLDAHVWGASCASRSQAITTGTSLFEYAYDSALHSARLIALFPRGAVVTTTARGGDPHSVRLDNGVLAINVSRPEQLTITIGHHTTIDDVAPTDANPAYGTANGSPSGSGTSSTVTGTSTSTAP
ncbi:MAG: hypothetical protein ABI323_05040 [Solirubrobacteraceae bacterium]